MPFMDVPYGETADGRRKPMSVYGYLVDFCGDPFDARVKVKLYKQVR